MRRISVSLSDELMQQLIELSEFNEQSLSALIADKVEESLEWDEDAYWLKMAKENERLSEGKPTISLEEAWANTKSKY